MKIIIAGGSGFLGQALLAQWAQRQGWEVVVLSRQGQASGSPARWVYWDGSQAGAWEGEIDGSDVVINLAGKSVNCRYTAKNKAAILNSRLDATRAIGNAIEKAARPPQVWINASSATYYRHAEDRPMDEYTGETAADFSMGVVQAWEGVFFSFETPKTRKIAARISLVLGRGGGVWPVLSGLSRWGLGSQIDRGAQMVSWIHEADVVAAFDFFIREQGFSGPVNLTSPNPVPNREFMKEIRQAARARFALPQPAWLTRVGAFALGTEAELVLKSRWVLPARLREWGFAFAYPSLKEAAQALSGEIQKATA